MLRHLLVSLVALGSLACGGAPAAEPATPVDESSSDATPAARKRGGPSVSSELGEIDQADAERAFAAAQPALSGCHRQGLGKLEVLAGDIQFLVRVGEDGTARYVLVEDSTLGDRATEKCMSGVLANSRWPVPSGGEAEARKSFSFTPGDAREPNEWASSKVEAAVGEKRGALESCGSGFHITGYVDPNGKDGKFTALGVSSRSVEANTRLDCVVDALRGAKLPSPGSYTAKVSFDF